MQPIDIFIGTYLRQYYTQKTLEYLEQRTKYPYRLFILNNGGNDEVLEAYKDKIFLRVDLKPNAGIHALWNIALSLAESKYFITSDNDIYVPDLNENSFNPHKTVTEDMILSESNNYKFHGDWLERMVSFMDERPDYAAISLHPHVFIGAAGIDPEDPEDVKERNMCGAVMRIMDTEKVREVGGWEHVVRSSRNHEERTICSRLQAAGYKVGIASRVRAYHPFGKDIGGNWGYPESITPEMQGHNPALKEEVQRFDNIEAYNQKTWLAK